MDRNATRDILAGLQAHLQRASAEMPANQFTLHGIWHIDIAFRPNDNERLFQYRVFVAQTENQGACYIHKTTSDFSPEIVGSDARHAKTGNHALDIAILDAAYSAICPPPKESHILEGVAHEKADQRARLIVNEVVRLTTAHAKYATHPNILVIGAIGQVIKHLAQRQFSVTATDLDSRLVGKQLYGITIKDGNNETISAIANSSIAIVTGMTLSTNTMEKIVAASRMSNTALIIVAETGAWFADYYCNNLGIDCVVSEAFPFYIFSGTTMINIHRKEKSQ